MKARKTMKNQQLIQEVIAQISQRFQPKIPDIKKVGPFLIYLSPAIANKIILVGHRSPAREGIH
jgi:hypothetical protein